MTLVLGAPLAARQSQKDRYSVGTRPPLLQRGRALNVSLPCGQVRRQTSRERHSTLSSRFPYANYRIGNLATMGLLRPKLVGAW